jgi:hypothetical protein
MSLGNEKPDRLARVEKSLWKTLLRIASGGSIATEMDSFLTAYTSQPAASNDFDISPNWFASGE